MKRVAVGVAVAVGDGVVRAVAVAVGLMEGVRVETAVADGLEGGEVGEGVIRADDVALGVGFDCWMTLTSFRGVLVVPRASVPSRPRISA
jgi:hypothetical protein